MNKHYTSILLAGALATGSATAATTITLHSNATGTCSTGGGAAIVNYDGSGSVGTNGRSGQSTHRWFHQISNYNVSTLMSDIGISNLSELSNYTFTYSGTTTAGASLAAGQYQVIYFGQYAGSIATSGLVSITPGNSSDPNWTSNHQAIEDFQDGLAEQSIDTGISDLAASQALSGDFDLSHLATDLGGDGDLSDNYLIFGLFYTPAGNNPKQDFDSISLTAAAVPEPSSAALLGLGGLAIILRRRK